LISAEERDARMISTEIELSAQKNK